MTILDDMWVKSDAQGVLLWDIDGTLIRKSRKDFPSIHLKALGLDEKTFRNEETAGLSDWDVLNLLGNQFFSIGELTESFFRLDELIYEEDFGKFEPLDGVLTQLKSTSENGWINGVLTGNTFKRAMLKLESGKLLPYFMETHIFTCFANESRTDIAFRAKKVLDEINNKKIIIGDTMNDIAAAKSIQYPVIAVASGSHSKNKLAEYNPNIILNDLNISPSVFLNYLENI